MDYVREMRKLIGHAPLILAGSGVLIFNQRNELLMMMRTDIRCWGIPGGCLEPGETLEQTAARETFEETGLRINHVTLFDIFSGPELVFQYPNGDVVVNVSAVYISRDAQGEIALNPEEHTGWQYFALDRLPEDISPPIKPVLARYIARYGTGSPPGG
jgi:8-oxo-dGTP pyrophosphatase MutT (NUDIX family)